MPPDTYMIQSTMKEPNETLPPKLYIGDSWCDSITAAATIIKSGYHVYVTVKKAHIRL